MKDNLRWLTVFDTETDGVDVENAHIIQAFVGRMGPDGEWIEKREWLIDHGLEMPTGASDVHGYTTERLRAEGRKDVDKAIMDIEGTIASWTGERCPLVAFNAAFDISLLTTQMWRTGYSWNFADSLVERGVSVIDPFVCDKAKDKYRRGKRKLVNVAPVYGVPVEENAHDAGADCLMAGRIAWKMVDSWKGSLVGLHDAQIGWREEQNQSLEDYFASAGTTNEDGSRILIDRGWPVYDKVRENNND